MRVAVFFVLTAALLGIVSSNMVCMQFKQAACTTMVRIPDYSDPFCSSHDERVECIRIAARECDVESSPIVGEVIERNAEACKEGTEMNNVYKNHKKCIFQDTAIGNNVCFQPMMAEGEKLGFPSLTRTYLEKFLKLTCKYRVSGNRCVDENVNSTCGADSAKFRHRLSHPAIRLSKKACEEVGLEIKPETNEMHSDLQQYDENSVHPMSPNIHHISALGPHPGSNLIASTVSPSQHPATKSAASIHESLQLIYVLVAAICMKWFSPY